MWLVWCATFFFLIYTSKNYHLNYFIIHYNRIIGKREDESILKARAMISLFLWLSHDEKYKVWTMLLLSDPTQIYPLSLTELWHESHYPTARNNSQMYTGVPLILPCLRNLLSRSLDWLKKWFLERKIWTLEINIQIVKLFHLQFWYHCNIKDEKSSIQGGRAHNTRHNSGVCMRKSCLSWAF